MPSAESQAFGKELLAFVDSSPTPFQLVSVVSKRLESEGFVELKEVDGWAANGLVKKSGKVCRVLTPDYPSDETKTTSPLDFDKCD